MRRRLCAVLVEAIDPSTAMGNGTFSAYPPQPLTIDRFEAGEAALSMSEEPSGGYRILPEGGGPYLLFDAVPDGLMCSELDGSGYSGSGSMGKVATPPPALVELAASVE